jgi:hypothetical protein
MAQQFTHTAKPPQIPDSHPHQRWFKRRGDDTMGHHICRMADDDTVDLSTHIHIGGSSASTRAQLTADECEELARALLDAAADLRAHTAAELVKANTEHNPDEVPE